MAMERKDFALSPGQRSDARTALRLIGDRDLTLTDCVRMALQLPSSRAAVSIGISQAIEEYLGAIDVRETTLAFYQTNLYRFESEIGHWSMSAITPELIRTYLDGLTGTRAQIYRTLKAWLRWCYRHDPPYLDADVMARISPPKTRPGKIGFMDLAQAKRALQHPEYSRQIALGMFAGIRMAELCRMDWQQVNVAEKSIRIDGETSKTGRGRIIEKAPDCLWHWLKGAPASGPLLNIKPENFGKSLRLWIPGFPANGLRHSFATYHVAAFREPGETALILGHEGGLQLLYTRYRGLATQADGRAYFAIVPGKDPDAREN